MEFHNPAAFWLLLLIIPLIYFTRNSISGLSKWRFISSLVIRILIFILIILAIGEIHLVKENEKLCVIFVTDLSKSISAVNKDQAVAFMNKSINEKKELDEAGLVVFGSNSFVEFIPSASGTVSEFSSMLDTNYSDISEALQLSLAMFPADSNKRIVLLSDGQENKGDALNEALLVASNNVPVDVVPLDSKLDQEIFINDFTLPEQVNINEPFEAKLVVQSSLNADVKAQFYRDNQLIGEDSLSLNTGKNVFFIPQEVLESGFYTYEVRLLPDKNIDSLIENNRSFCYTKALGKPLVLFVQGDMNDDGAFVRALESESLEVIQVSDNNIPSELTDLQNYQTIIFSDVSSVKLSNEQMLQIESYVRDLGGGFIMIGGENSFGVGGYYDTPIEETLPVSMDIRKDRHLPTMALVLVIDKSGSMADYGSTGLEKIVLAREAAIACVDLLSPADQIGVVGFDDAAKWVLPFQKRAENKGSIIRDLSSMKAGGGTNIFPALSEANRVLAGTKAILKHIILLTDGRTSPANFDDLIKIINSNQITLSCVGIGQDADMPFLHDLADKGGGRIYHASDVSLLPRIFTKEALIASRAAIVEESFFPLLNRYNQVVSGIDWEKAPSLDGYVVTTSKNRAEDLLVAREEDPLLSVWHYGLGKSMAFTSDTKSRWASEWIKWNSFSPFWAQAVRWTMRGEESSNLDISISYEEGKGKVIVDAINEEGEFMNLLDLRARVVNPDFESCEVPLKQSGPGRYEGTFPGTNVGTYLINVGGENAGSKTVGFAFSIPPEYKTLGADRFILSSIANETGGRVLSLKDYKNVYNVPTVKSTQVKEIWPLLIIWALCLLPFDIGIRRIYLPEDWKEKIIKRLGFLRKKKFKDVKSDLSRLKMRKSKVIQERKEKVSLIKVGPVKGQKMKIILPEKKVAEKVEPAPKVIEKKPDSLSRLKSAKKKARDGMKE